MHKFVIGGFMAFGCVVGVSACSTISEEECLAGNWEAIGFKDGASGRSPERLADYSKACTKYGASVDHKAWLKAYEQGLPRYCTYGNGYELGRSGSGYNQVCSGELAEGFAQGFQEGRVVYQMQRRYEQLLGRYNQVESYIYDVERRLSGSNLSNDERNRLRRKLRRLRSELRSLEWEIRDFRHRYNFGYGRF